jgi:hypothetical protein
MLDHTTTRLRNLRPGERMTFYRGDLATDASRAVREAPTCAELLLTIQRTVGELERAGRIKVTARVVEVPPPPAWPWSSKRAGPLLVTEYTATGTEPPRLGAPLPSLTQARACARAVA